jgi:uncharacterized protein YifN (PemK superfamily)
MDEIIITYKDLHSQEELGRETYEGVTEVTFPDVSYRNHPITITKMFKDQPCHRWIVKELEHKGTEIALHLEPRDNSSDEEFLRKTYLNHTNILKNLTIGTFVEVDFGYIHSTKKVDGKLGSIKRYPDLANEGEMHKRRLCIVVKAMPDYIQVVPISSQEQSLTDPSICLISHDSLKDLVNYNREDKQSFSLAHMVEAVSLNRVLPPKSKNNDGLYRNNAYNKRLTKTDLRKFIKSLAFGVSLNDYTKVKEENSKNFLENQQLKQELEELKVKVADLTSSVRTHEATMCLLEDTYNSFGMDTSLIPSKVEELHEILDSK